MPESDLLGPLVDAIETVKQRIQEHGSSLRENETRTRVALIDPILQALGWDVSDPASVTVEHRTANKGRTDYALLKDDGSVIASVEAKSLNHNLGLDEQEQMERDAKRVEARFGVLTDGSDWQICSLYGGPRHEDRYIADVHLSQQSSYEAALKLLLLWRPNLESGQPVKANEPLTGIPDNPEEAPQEPTVQPKNGKWVLFTSIKSLANNKPQAVRFPGDQEVPIPIQHWYEVWLEFGKFVHRGNYLNGKRLPLESPQQRKPILGNSKFSQTCKQAGDLPIYIEDKGNSQLKLKWVEHLAQELQVGTIEVRLQH